MKNIALCLALFMITGCSLLCHNEKAPPQKGAVVSRAISDKSFLMSCEWDEPGELLVYTRGWNISIFGPQGEISLRRELPYSPLTIKTFDSSPAYDYARLSGSTGGFEINRHILLDKLTGIVIVSDEIPVEHAPPFRMLLNGRRVKPLMLEQAHNRTIIVDPLMRTADLSLSEWDALITPLSDIEAEPTGAAVRVDAEGRTSYYWLSHATALVADNVEDNIVEGRVAAIHKSPEKTTLALISGNWMQSGSLILRMSPGSGVAQFHPTGLITGWTDGGWRDVIIDAGTALDDATLTIDGKQTKLLQKDARLMFRQRPGARAFTIR